MMLCPLHSEAEIVFARKGLLFIIRFLLEPRDLVA